MKDEQATPGSVVYHPIHPSSLIPHPFFNVLAETSECMNPQSGAELRQYR
jgi:hypothetical protein